MIESDNPLMEPAWHLGPSKFNVWCLVIGIIAAGVTETYRYKMSKKETTKYSNAGKGDKSRISDKKQYDTNYEKIFGKDIKRVNQQGAQLGLSNPRYHGDGTEWIVERDKDGKLYRRMFGTDIKEYIDEGKM
ncbi:MAG: hypothetical protein CMP37_04285 [Rickettsiales bacterium]|nr:hypothetical protein [Rickettsiales bacterium]